MYTQTQMHTHKRTSTHIHGNRHTNTHIYTQTNTSTHIHTNTHINKHAHQQTYTKAHICYIQTRAPDEDITPPFPPLGPRVVLTRSAIAMAPTKELSRALSPLSTWARSLSTACIAGGVGETNKAKGNSYSKSYSYICDEFEQKMNSPG